MCGNKDIQELLPAYLAEAVGAEDRARVERHLADCGDCRSELGILRALAAEPVPDPGDAFWAAMPGRVARGVRKAQERHRPWWDVRVPAGLVLPRWAWAAAVVLLVALVSWVAVRPSPMRTARVKAPANGDLRAVLHGADLPDLADLTDIEIDAVDLWATEELALLQDDYLDILRNSADLGLDDRLAELTAEELDALSRMLDGQNEEG